MEKTASKTEDLLVHRARQGDRAAFGALFTLYGERLFRRLLPMVRGNQHEAEELAQEAFLKAFNAMAGFQGDSTFFTWLNRIATNLTLDRLKKKRLPSTSLEHEPGLQPPDLRNEPCQAVTRLELRHMVEQAINQLPDELRVVFVMRELDGLQPNEVAELVGCSPELVRVRHHRAKKKLMALLAPYAERKPK